MVKSCDRRQWLASRGIFSVSWYRIALMTLFSRFLEALRARDTSLCDSSLCNNAIDSWISEATWKGRGEGGGEDHSHRRSALNCNHGQDFWHSENGGLFLLATATSYCWPAQPCLLVASSAEHRPQNMVTAWPFDWYSESALTIWLHLDCRVTILNTAPMGVTPVSYVYELCTWVVFKYYARYLILMIVLSTAHHWDRGKASRI